MSGSPNFGGTITGGIQDISALLPLLGTEQCEKHVGSALDRGFLYSSVTPLSIFGSLGIVRAAFNILVASLNIQRIRFLGATKLSDGGFNPNGVVAPMIALDPRHPKRFLAETKLEAMLTEEHIENVEDLTVSWGKGILWWNFLLIAFTLVISSTGLVPYIRIILDSRHATLKALFPLGFGFPILRVVGSGLCVNVAQFLIQLRVLVLLKTRLLYITIDRLAKEAGIDLESEVNSQLSRKRGKSAWNSELASEKCIWALRKCLANSDAESWKHHAKIKETYTSQYKRQMEGIDARIPRWVGPLLVVGLVLGCLSTVVGYIGCFYLIQHSTSSNGPLLWLVLEALLSIFRILVWAINPSWDDSKGIVFELQLASHAPLITCNKFEGDIVHDGVAALMRSNRFLEEVVAYTGPFPAFVVPDVALYYILTAKGGSESKNAEIPPPGILYIVLSDHKEQTSRILFKDGHRDDFAIYISSLEPVPGSTAINVRVDFSKEGRRTEPRTHFLTSDPVFMAQLEAHYDEITSKIQKQRSNMDRKAFFGKTWAMQKPIEDNQGDDEEGSADDVDDKEHPALEVHEMSGPLTAEDMAYLRQGQVERRWHDMYKQLEEWVGLFITLYTKELLQDVPTDLVFRKDESVQIVQKYEANEVEFLLIECRRVLELLVISTAAKWDEYAKRDHAKMVRDVLHGTFGMIDPKTGACTMRKQHSEDIRKNKMLIRLADELETLFEKEVRTRRDNRTSRLAAQTDSTNQRIQGRQYTDAVGETIMNAWKALPTDIAAEATQASDPADTPEETNSVAKSTSRSGSVISLGSTHKRSASIKENIEVLSSSDNGRGTQENNEKEGSVKSDVGRIVKTIASRRAEFITQLDARSEDAKKEVNNYKDDVERNKQLVEVKQMNDRCRQRADQLFSRLEAQTAEFEDLHTNDVLTAETHECVDYWSDQSLQERRRLLDRTQQYLNLNNGSIEAVGGRQNMLRALKRSQDFSFIDIHESELLTSEDLVSVIKQVKSLTGVTSSGDGQEVYKAVMDNVRAAVGAHHDKCLYANLIVTDHYRTGKPYLLFVVPGASFCDVYFHIQAKCDHTVTLRHCVTTENGKVRIKLNGHELRGDWGQTQAVQFNFTNEDIHLPSEHLRDVGQPNVLEIILDDESRGVYWLSDVFLPVQPVQLSVTPDMITTT